MPDVGTGVTVGTTVLNHGQARSATSAANRASRGARDESARQFDLVREDTRLSREVGNDALMELGFVLGLRKAPAESDFAAIDAELEQARAMPTKRAVTRTETYGKNDQHERTVTRYVGDGVMEAEKNARIAELEKKKASMTTMQGIGQKYKDGLGGFITSQPSYQFELEEGQKAIQNQATASGTPLGGNTLKAATKYSQDLASTKTDQHIGRLFTLAGYGPVGANLSASAGANLSQASALHASNVADNAYTQARANIGLTNNLANNLVTLDEYNRKTRPVRNMGEPNA